MKNKEENNKLQLENHLLNSLKFPYQSISTLFATAPRYWRIGLIATICSDAIFVDWTSHCAATLARSYQTQYNYLKDPYLAHCVDVIL